MCRYQRKLIRYADMLGTVFFAPVTLNTIRCLSSSHSQSSMIHIRKIIINTIVVIQCKSPGILIFLGHTSIQYPHDVHCMDILLLIISTTLPNNSFSLSLSGCGLSIILILSCTCERLLIPLNTINTPGSYAANLSAYEAVDASSLYSLRILSASSGRSASVPPLTGSITAIGLLCFPATS